MKTIWKYAFPISPTFTLIELPRGAEILHVGVQEEYGNLTPTLWARIDRDSPPVRHRILTVATGGDVPEDVEALAYIGTIMTGPYVWHVFIEGKEQ